MLQSPRLKLPYKTNVGQVAVSVNLKQLLRARRGKSVKPQSFSLHPSFSAPLKEVWSLLFCLVASSENGAFNITLLHIGGRHKDTANILHLCTGREGECTSYKLREKDNE